MRMITKLMKAIGMTLFFFGAGSMDSASLIIPAIMLFTGLAIFAYSAAREEGGI